MIAVLVFYIWYFITSFRLYHTAAYQNGMEIIGVGLMLATFTYMIISFLNDSTVSVAPIYWVMMGMGVAVNEAVKKQHIQDLALAVRSSAGSESEGRAVNGTPAAAQSRTAKRKKGAKR